ncbi:MAG: hypothetical protein GY757_45690 [bacterium]|nr:hypothetical protein [bacterium]
MQQVVLNIRNTEKAKFLLDFLRQLDFIEIKQVLEEKQRISHSIKDEAEDLSEILLNAPVLSSEEIENIERVGKEFGNWKIEEF